MFTFKQNTPKYPSRGRQTRTLGTCHIILHLIAIVIPRIQEYLCKI